MFLYFFLPCTGSRVAPPPGSLLTNTADVYAHTRSIGFGKEVKKRLLLGTYALSAEYVFSLSLSLFLLSHCTAYIDLFDNQCV
jgi:hypothetical protein